MDLLRKLKKRVPVPAWGVIVLLLFAGLGWAFTTLAPTYDDVNLYVVKVELKGDTSGKAYTWTGKQYGVFIDRGKWWYTWEHAMGDGWAKLTNPKINIEVASYIGVSGGYRETRTAPDGTQYRIYSWDLYWSVRIKAVGWTLSEYDGGTPGMWQIDYNVGPWGSGVWAYGVPEPVHVTLWLRWGAVWSGWRFGKAWCHEIIENEFWKYGSGSLQPTTSGELDGPGTPADYKPYDVDVEGINPDDEGDLVEAYYGSGNPDDALASPALDGTRIKIEAYLSPGFAAELEDWGHHGNGHASGEAELIIRIKLRVWAYEKIDPQTGGGEEQVPEKPDPHPEQIDKEQPLWFVALVMVIIAIIMIAFAWVFAPAMRAAGHSKHGWIIVVPLAVLMIVVFVLIVLWASGGLAGLLGVG